MAVAAPTSVLVAGAGVLAAVVAAEAVSAPAVVAVLVAVVPREVGEMASIFQRLARLVRHRCAEWQLGKVLPPATLKELEQLIAQSELGHSGQVRICVEAGLPFSYIWRDATARERGLSMFSKLRVWDTEHNNGALIYLLLADHAIEIVADRALERSMTPEQWQTLVSDMSAAFRQNQFAPGLKAALERVSAQLIAHFPRQTAADSDSVLEIDNLPDSPVVQRHWTSR